MCIQPFAFRQIVHRILRFGEECGGSIYTEFPGRALASFEAGVGPALAATVVERRDLRGD